MSTGTMYCDSCKKYGVTCLLVTPTTLVNNCRGYDPNDDIDICEEKNVNHPSHYTQGGIECIKAIEASMNPKGFQDYCKGNVLKYIWRWRDKNGIEDLKKALVYLKWLLESAEKELYSEDSQKDSYGGQSNEPV